MQSGLGFIADENFDKETAWLPRKGYDVTFVAEFMAGADDEVVLARAEEEQKMALTADQDFGDLVFRQSKYGVGLLNPFTVIQTKNLGTRKMQQ